MNGRKAKPMFGWSNATGLAGAHSEDFLKTTSEAIAWAEAYADINEPKSSLRRLEKESWWGHLSSPCTRVDSLNSVRRRKLSHCEGVTSTGLKERAQEGRFLAYFPEQELFDGVAEAYSLGFFDVHNAPPHDTWITLIAGQESERDDFLLSWVPPAFLGIVNNGIEVNPEECILWFDDLDHPVVPIVRELGLIQ